MSRGAFLTPVFVFGSTRPGAGKSSLVAHLATWWHSQGRKVAIIDLNGAFPMQLRCAFARALQIEEYPELSEIAGRISGRFKRNFFFANTERLSLFPSGLVRDPANLVHDAALRDFYLQVRGTFDIVLINLQPGIQAVAAAENFLTRRGGREGSPPTGVLITTTEQRHLLSIDSLVRSRPAFPYLFAESLFVIFNRIPRTVEQQTIAEELVGTSEVRSILKLPLATNISTIDEWQRQPFDSNPLVLADPSLLRQTISGLARRLLDIGDLPPHETSEAESDHDGFGPCLEPALLDRLQPLMEAFRETLARRLFMPVDEISSFLETSDQHLRLRIRLSGRARPSFPVHRSLPYPGPGDMRRPSLPSDFSFRLQVAMETERAHEKNVALTLGAEPVYQFDDRFADRTAWDLRFGPPWLYSGPAKRFEDLFKQEVRLSDVPTLGQMLGFGRKRRVTLEPHSPPPGAFSLNETGHLTPHSFEVATTSSRVPLQSSPVLNGPATRWLKETLLHLPALGVPLFNPGPPLSVADLPDVFKRNWKLTDVAFATNSSFHRLPGIIPTLRIKSYGSPRGFSGDLQPGKIDLSGLLARSPRIDGPGVSQRFSQIKLKTFTPSVGLATVRSFPGAPPLLKDTKVVRLLERGIHSWSRPAQFSLLQGPGWSLQPRLSVRRDLPAKASAAKKSGCSWPLEHPTWTPQNRSVHRFARPRTIPSTPPTFRPPPPSSPDPHRFTMNPVLIEHSLDVLFPRHRGTFCEIPLEADQRQCSRFILSPAFPRRHSYDSRSESASKPNAMVPLRLSLTLRDMLWPFRHLPMSLPVQVPSSLRSIFPSLGLRERLAVPSGSARLSPTPTVLDAHHPGARGRPLWRIGKPETISHHRLPSRGNWSPALRDKAGAKEPARISLPILANPNEDFFRFALCDRSDSQRFQTVQRQSFCFLGASNRYALHSDIPFVTQDLVTRAYYGYVPREAWFHQLIEPLAIFLRPLKSLSVLLGTILQDSAPIPIFRDLAGDVEQRRSVLPIFHREHRWPFPPHSEGNLPYHWLFPNLPQELPNLRDQEIQVSPFSITLPQKAEVASEHSVFSTRFTPEAIFHPRAVENPYHLPSLDFRTSALTRPSLTGHGLKVVDFLYQHLLESIHADRELPYPKKNEKSIGTIFRRESTGFRVGERCVWKDASLHMRFGRLVKTLAQPGRSWLNIIDPKRRDLLSAALRVSKQLDDTAQPLLDSVRKRQP